MLLVEAGLAVVVRAAAEDVLQIESGRASREWGAVGYWLGNLHRPARFARARDPHPLRRLQRGAWLRDLGAAVPAAPCGRSSERGCGAVAHHHADGHDHDHQHVGAA